MFARLVRILRLFVIAAAIGALAHAAAPHHDDVATHERCQACVVSNAVAVKAEPANAAVEPVLIACALLVCGHVVATRESRLRLRSRSPPAFPA